MLVLQPLPQPFLLLSAPQARAEFTLADEMELGQRFYLMIRSSIPIVQDPEVIAYAEYMVNRLIRHMPTQPYRFKVTVIQDNSINAFAIPGGYVFLHTGLIMAMQHESEVAGVLAHELAHVTQRHIAGRIEQAQRVTIISMLGLLAGIFLGGGQAGAALAMGSVAAGQSAMLSYSRTDESEADHVGMNYYIAAGYPPEGMANAFRTIQRPQWATGSDIPPYLSTHPAVPERVADMSARIATMQVPPENLEPEDDSNFLRIQTLIRGRYANPDAARQFFQEQLKSDANKDMAYLGLGILNDRVNRTAEAQNDFDQALKLRPDDQIFLREAGRFNYLKGDKNKAISYLQQATSQNPRDYLAMFYYARLLSDSDQLEQSISYYKQVLRYQPEDWEVHYYYAQTLGKAQQTFSAYLHLAFSALYENRPKKTEQAYNRVKSMAKTEQEKEDLAFFEKKYQERKAYWK